MCLEVGHVGAGRLPVLKHPGERLVDNAGVEAQHLLLLHRAFQHLPFLGRLAGQKGQRALKRVE